MKNVFFVIISNLFCQAVYATLCNPFSIKIDKDYTSVAKVIESSRTLFKIDGDDDVIDHLKTYLRQAKNQKKMLEFTGLEGGTILDIEMLDDYLQISDYPIETENLDPFALEIKKGSFFKTGLTGVVFYDHLALPGRRLLTIPRSLHADLLNIISLAKHEQKYLSLLRQDGAACETREQLTDFLTVSEDLLPQNHSPQTNAGNPQEPNNQYFYEQEAFIQQSAPSVQTQSNNHGDQQSWLGELDPCLSACLWGSVSNEESQPPEPSAPAEELLLDQSERTHSDRSSASQSQDSRCVICLDKKRNHIFLPCYHMVTCEE